MPYRLLLGGARSGKSDLAVRSAASSGRPVVLVATAEARDDEMADRIERHRAARPHGWTTLEVPVAVGRALETVRPDAFVVLDCLSLWVSNAIEAGVDDDAIVDDARAIASRLRDRGGPAAVVSNEVGLGIVPVNPLARRYRDLLGRVNVTFADAADIAYLCVAGKALRLTDPTLA
jgi:adenosyl cobinamide kinase/adenosyl cobinamide phosphate guanylyltransferase